MNEQSKTAIFAKKISKKKTCTSIIKRLYFSSVQLNPLNAEASSEADKTKAQKNLQNG